MVLIGLVLTGVVLLGLVLIGEVLVGLVLVGDVLVGITLLGAALIGEEPTVLLEGFPIDFLIGVVEGLAGEALLGLDEDTPGLVLVVEGVELTPSDLEETFVALLSPTLLVVVDLSGLDVLTGVPTGLTFTCAFLVDETAGITDLAVLIELPTDCVPAKAFVF